MKFCPFVSAKRVGESTLVCKTVFRFSLYLTERMSVEFTVLALHSDSLGGSSRVFSPAVKRLDERLRDEPKKRLQRFMLDRNRFFLESPGKALDVLKKVRADFNVGCV